MGTAVLPARRVSVSAWTLAPTALAAVAGLAYLVLEPRPGDLAVHEFRAELFGREAYSVITPSPVAGLFTGLGGLAYSTRFAPERVVEHGRRCDDG